MRPRRRFWVRFLAFLGFGALLLFAGFSAAVNSFDAQALRGAAHAGREWLARYGGGLHIASHGLTYLCLIGFWPRILAWAGRQRRQRGLPDLTAREGRRLAVTVVLLCAGYEALLWSSAWA